MDNVFFFVGQGNGWCFTYT